jgi:periplasmic divalent cation tolerance protein
MQSSAIVVLITVPSREVGRQVAEALLEGKLAACVNIIPAVNSLYWWGGEIQDDQETLLVVKTRAEIFQDQLVPAVREVHPYDLPEIIALPVVMGLDSYLQWIEDETR